MKCTVVFLVLSMVVLMAEPGECIFGMLVHGAIHSTVAESVGLLIANLFFVTNDWKNTDNKW